MTGRCSTGSATSCVRTRSGFAAHHGGYFWDFVARSYVARSAIGVRRHVKRDDGSVSLVQILSQMKDCAPQLTFDFYLQQFPRNDADDFFWQKPTFKLVSENGVVASGQIIASDIEKLKLLTVQVETFVDKSSRTWTAKGSTAGSHSTISTGLWIPSTR